MKFLSSILLISSAILGRVAATLPFAYENDVNISEGQKQQIPPLEDIVYINMNKDKVGISSTKDKVPVNYFKKATFNSYEQMDFKNFEKSNNRTVCDVEVDERYINVGYFFNTCEDNIPLVVEYVNYSIERDIVTNTKYLVPCNSKQYKAGNICIKEDGGVLFAIKNGKGDKAFDSEGNTDIVNPNDYETTNPRVVSIDFKGNELGFPQYPNIVSGRYNIAISKESIIIISDEGSFILEERSEGELVFVNVEADSKISLKDGKYKLYTCKDNTGDAETPDEIKCDVYEGGSDTCIDNYAYYMRSLSNSITAPGRVLKCSDNTISLYTNKYSFYYNDDRDDILISCIDYDNCKFSCGSEVLKGFYIDAITNSIIRCDRDNNGQAVCKRSEGVDECSNDIGVAVLTKDRMACVAFNSTGIDLKKITIDDPYQYYLAKTEDVVDFDMNYYDDNGNILIGVSANHVAIYTNSYGFYMNTGFNDKHMIYCNEEHKCGESEKNLMDGYYVSVLDDNSKGIMECIGNGEDYECELIRVSNDPSSHYRTCDDTNFHIGDVCMSRSGVLVVATTNSKGENFLETEVVYDSASFNTKFPGGIPITVDKDTYFPGLDPIDKTPMIVIVTTAITRNDRPGALHSIDYHSMIAETYPYDGEERFIFCKESIKNHVDCAEYGFDFIEDVENHYTFLVSQVNSFAYNRVYVKFGGSNSYAILSGYNDSFYNSSGDNGKKLIHCDNGITMCQTIDPIDGYFYDKIEHYYTGAIRPFVCTSSDKQCSYDVSAYIGNCETAEDVGKLVKNEKTEKYDICYDIGKYELFLTTRYYMFYNLMRISSSTSFPGVTLKSGEKERLVMIESSSGHANIAHIKSGYININDHEFGCFWDVEKQARVCSPAEGYIFNSKYATVMNCNVQVEEDEEEEDEDAFRLKKRYTTIYNIEELYKMSMDEETKCQPLGCESVYGDTADGEDQFLYDCQNTLDGYLWSGYCNTGVYVKEDGLFFCQREMVDDVDLRDPPKEEDNGALSSISKPSYLLTIVTSIAVFIFMNRN